MCAFTSVTIHPRAGPVKPWPHYSIVCRAPEVHLNSVTTAWRAAMDGWT